MVVPSIQNSVQLALQISTPNVVQLDSIIDLGNSFITINEDTTALLLDWIMAMAIKYFNDEEVHGSALILKSRHLVNIGELESAKQSIESARSILERRSLHNEVADADRLIGRVYFNNSEYDLAAEKYLSAVKIWEDAKDSTRVYRPYIDLAQLFFVLGQEKKGYFIIPKL